MKQILIIGMGELGQHLANQLDQLGSEVAVVDIDEKIIDELRIKFPNSFIGDCRQVNFLKELGIKQFDSIVVCVGGDFQASLEITNNLSELGAEHIIAKSSSETQSKLLSLVGAHQTIYPEKEEAEKLATILNSGEKIKNYIRIGSNMGIYQIKPPKSWIGKKLKDLNVRTKYKVNIACIETDLDEFDIPDAGTELDDNDLIYVIGKAKDVEKINKLK